MCMYVYACTCVCVCVCVRYRYSVCEFVHHFLLHSVGGHSLLSTLSLSLDTANSLHASRLRYSPPQGALSPLSNHTSFFCSDSSPVLQVEALKIAFHVIDLLLLNKKSQVSHWLQRILDIPHPFPAPLFPSDPHPLGASPGYAVRETED